MSEEEKKQIDEMSQYEMCYLWRFGKCGNKLLQGDTGKYFSKIMKEKGGMTTEISKELGWKPC